MLKKQKLLQHILRDVLPLLSRVFLYGYITLYYFLTVFHGRVEKSFVTSGNRTQYVVNMLTSFKSTFEIPDRMKIRLADSACLCNQLSVGKEFLFMGRVKDKGDGKARMTLSRKSFVQRWDDSLYAAIDYVKPQCKSPLMEFKINKTTSEL